MPPVTSLAKLTVPLLALSCFAARAHAQAAETAPAGPGGPRADTARHTPAGDALRQRWASPFAVEGSGQTAPREPRAHVTWLPPDTARRGTPAAAPRTGRTQRADTSTRRPAAPPPAAARPRTHTVARGETFLGIARRYGVTQDALRTANPGVEWQHVRIGVVLRIPPAPAAAAARPSAAHPAAGRGTTTTRPADEADSAANDSAADDSIPHRAVRRDTTARVTNARRDTASIHPAAARPARRDSTAARPPATRRDSTTSRRTATPARDTASTRRPTVVVRDTDASRRAATARRDSAAARTDAGGARRHQVAAGESLFSIARRYGVPAQRIRDVNGLTDDRVRVGQVLVIPPGA
jgi:LysM repeat protein